MRGRIQRTLIAAIVAATSGCSFVSVRRAPPISSEEAPQCTVSRTSPGLDTAGAITSAVAGVGIWGLCSAVAAMNSWGDSDPPNCAGILWAGAISTAAYTASAVYGYRATGECRRRVAEWQASPADSARPTR